MKNACGIDNVMSERGTEQWKVTYRCRWCTVAHRSDLVVCASDDPLMNGMLSDS